MESNFHQVVESVSMAWWIGMAAGNYHLNGILPLYVKTIRLCYSHKNLCCIKFGWRIQETSTS